MEREKYEMEKTKSNIQGGRFRRLLKYNKA